MVGFGSMLAKDPNAFTRTVLDGLRRSGRRALQRRHIIQPVTEAVCSACQHHIDPAAKICPYCGADPRTGEKVIDTRAMVEEVFRPREVSTSESVIEYARQRQGLVIGVAMVVIFLGLALLHQFVTHRNEATVTFGGYWRAGESVVLDATWPTEAMRDAARRVAGMPGPWAIAQAS